MQRYKEELEVENQVLIFFTNRQIFFATFVKIFATFAVKNII
jgi:hypothetical protein